MIHRLARPPRFERGAFGSGGQRSIHLSYGRFPREYTPRLEEIVLYCARRIQSCCFLKYRTFCCAQDCAYLVLRYSRIMQHTPPNSKFSYAADIRFLTFKIGKMLPLCNLFVVRLFLCSLKKLACEV